MPTLPEIAQEKKNNICEKLPVTFHRSAIERILTYFITLWFSRCTAADRERLADRGERESGQDSAEDHRLPPPTHPHPSRSLPLP